MRLFSDLDLANIKGHIIFLDIDGTIALDGKEDLDHKEIIKIKELKINNTLYLCSNKKSHCRNTRIAKKLGINYIKSDYRKPSRKILNSLDNLKNKKLLVIGDKFMTDGLFAKNINADFIKVKNMTSSDEKLLVKSICKIDNYTHKTMQYFHLLRPLQWVKNLLVFAPIFFAKEIFDSDKLLQAIYAFLVFCSVASCMYIINDFADRKEDRLHSRKKNRPLASRAITTSEAIAVFAFMITGALLILFFLIPQIILVILVYIILNLTYSFYLKKLAIFDILTVSVFYLLRITAGGTATSTYISPWLILCLIFASLFVIIGKRKAESYRDQKRKVLHCYGGPLLNSLFVTSASLTLICYGLYSILGTYSSIAVYSIFFVLLGIFRYLQVVYDSKEEAEFPEKIIFSDKIILGSLAGWTIFMSLILYFSY